MSSRPFSRDRVERQIRQETREILALGDKYHLRSFAHDHALKGTSLDAFRLALAAKLADSSPNRVGLSDADLQRYSLLGAIRTVWEGGDLRSAHGGVELEAHRALCDRLGPCQPNTFRVPQEVLERDLTVASATGGGYLKAGTAVSFVEAMRASSVLLRAGALHLPGLVGDLVLARESAEGTAYWLPTEGTPATESQQTFGAVSLRPKNLVGIMVLSQQLVRQVSPAVEQALMASLGKTVGKAYDRGGINGSGASGEPTGILNTAGLGTVVGTSLGHAGLVELQSDLADSEVEASAETASYITTPTVAKLLKGRYIGSGAVPLWSGNLWRGEIEGLAASATKQMPAATMLFGDFSQVVIGDWGGLSIEVNPYHHFPSGKVSMRAWYTADVAVRHPAAFSAAVSIT